MYNLDKLHRLFHINVLLVFCGVWVRETSAWRCRIGADLNDVEEVLLIWNASQNGIRRSNTYLPIIPYVAPLLGEAELIELLFDYLLSNVFTFEYVPIGKMIPEQEEIAHLCFNTAF